MTDKTFTSRPAWLIALITIAAYFLLDRYVGATSRGLVKALAGEAPSLLRTCVRALLHYPGPYIIVPAVITAVIVGQKNFLEVWGFDKCHGEG